MTDKCACCGKPATQKVYGFMRPSFVEICDDDNCLATMKSERWQRQDTAPKNVELKVITDRNRICRATRKTDNDGGNYWSYWQKDIYEKVEGWKRVNTQEEETE